MIRKSSNLLNVTQLGKDGSRIQTQATQVLTAKLKLSTIPLPKTANCCQTLRSTLYFPRGIILILDEFQFSPSFTEATNIDHIQEVPCYGFIYVAHEILIEWL